MTPGGWLGAPGGRSEARRPAWSRCAGREAGRSSTPKAATTPPPAAVGVVRCYCLRSPEGIRTLATAVRGRRPRPLDDGALETKRNDSPSGGSFRNTMLHERSGPLRRQDQGLDHAAARRYRPIGLTEGDLFISGNSAGVLGLEPRMAEPESAVLPITPYPKGLAGAGAGGRVYLPGERTRKSMPLLVFAVRAQCANRARATEPADPTDPADPAVPAGCRSDRRSDPVERGP